MRKILLVILIFLGIVLVVEVVYLAVIKQSSSKLAPAVITPSPTVLPLPSSAAKMIEHNFAEIYKDITNPKTDVLPSSILTNTYQGKINKISKQAGVIQGTDFAYRLYFELKGEKGNTKRMFFNDKQIASMEKQGFADVFDLKVGDQLQVTLVYNLISDDPAQITALKSSKIVRIR